MASVALMQDSRLPCFGRGAPIPNLRKRFHLDMTEAKAAAFMRSTILDAYDKVMPSVHELASVVCCVINDDFTSYSSFAPSVQNTCCACVVCLLQVSIYGVTLKHGCGIEKVAVLKPELCNAGAMCHFE